MPQFHDYERDGRRLMVEFECSRCGGVRIEPLEPLVGDEGYGYLHNLKRPEGWKEIWGLFCPTCVSEFAAFMRQGKIEEKESTS